MFPMYSSGKSKQESTNFTQYVPVPPNVTSLLLAIPKLLDADVQVISHTLLYTYLLSYCMQHAHIIIYSTQIEWDIAVTWYLFYVHCAESRGSNDTSYGRGHTVGKA